MAARRLFGATRTWAGWRPRELPDPAAPGRLLVRDYAKKPVLKGGKGGKSGVVSDVLKDPEVCTDPVRLTTHAMGVNIYKEGQDVVLKPDAEYPEWLFQMNVGPPKKLEELDPESWEYWRLLRKHNIWRHNRLSKNRKF
ncbi:PREDICTED: 39S ribosomal protein L54, mitochondrial [Myotis davidii]|nr:39S ribosomal protein L54, mitochondrial [Myotis lucifugus]XP_006754131.1 PREDICTED: 39S ribosomal protein L54, mitochondrial [Myotis davidii]XP_036171064.1 39S ribosomal protein L54, mitochondrial [Myotis myotis]ELK37465.1 39S ribosomal protein L54, mitochondrial [Myotis davidii]KAF6349432.1 mitochondrial ribosomal protein L54 [Myotis myotis]